MAEFGSSDSGASLGDILGAALEKKNQKRNKQNSKWLNRTHLKITKKNSFLYQKDIHKIIDALFVSILLKL